MIGKMMVLRRSLADSLKLILRKPTSESVKFAKLMLKLKPQFTMVTNKNLLTLYELVREVNRLGIGGDIVECGVWNGGSAAVMALAHAESKNVKNRTIWLFDSFQGLPPAGEKDGDLERVNYFVGWNKGDPRKVRQAFEKVGVPLTNVQIIPGWFDETLKSAKMDAIALLHIDSDWYDSVKIVLDRLYEKVVPGGFVILNDYGTWEGCDRAFADFKAEQTNGHIKLTIVEPGLGAFFQKPGYE